MSDISIKVENLSKLYQLGEVGTGTLGKDLNRWWARVRGQENPYAKVGQVNNRTKKAESDFVWALKDIYFDVKQGEVLGIIGRNGAGKSTLLKILSKITSPTTGKIYTKGRIASLLEVGTGFHPEMTGRENIYLNGAILGMRKWEIGKKFNEIVDFAGVEAYIDTPVKRYSSGMYVRLAFAVAAFLEPEILIVDEVLAVGDAEFQKKCLGRIKDVSINDGRTVLFVSHNLSSVRHLCSSGLVLKNGSISYFGECNKSIENYLSEQNVIESKGEYRVSSNSEKEVFLEYAFFQDSINRKKKYLFNAEEEIVLSLLVRKTSEIRSVYLHLVVLDDYENIIVETDSYDYQNNFLDSIRVGCLKFEFKFNSRIFKTGRYFISVGLASTHASNFQIESLHKILGFDVLAESVPRDSNRRAMTSYIPHLSCCWES